MLDKDGGVPAERYLLKDPFFRLEKKTPPEVTLFARFFAIAGSLSTSLVKLFNPPPYFVCYFFGARFLE